MDRSPKRSARTWKPVMGKSSATTTPSTASEESQDWDYVELSEEEDLTNSKGSLEDPSTPTLPTVIDKFRLSTIPEEGESRAECTVVPASTSLSSLASQSSDLLLPQLRGSYSPLPPELHLEDINDEAQPKKVCEVQATQEKSPIIYEAYQTMWQFSKKATPPRPKTFRRAISPRKGSKPYLTRGKQTVHSTKPDPHAVGLVATMINLREDTILQDELKRDEESMEWLKRQKTTTCSCDVANHPSYWSQRIIDKVHDYDFLLDCKDLIVSKEMIIAANKSYSIIIINVPMVDGQPWKIKAEQVLRYIDVEVGIGDQTAYDIMYYRQPCDRKILLILFNQRVIGLVVAERLQWAHRILIETDSIMTLEEDPVPVKLGINQLWVHISMRRHRFATVLCEVAGRIMFDGKELHRNDFAFNYCVPDMGIAFAKLFVKQRRPPLYKGKPGRNL